MMFRIFSFEVIKRVIERQILLSLQSPFRGSFPSPVYRGLIFFIINIKKKASYHEYTHCFYIKTVRI